MKAAKIKLNSLDYLLGAVGLLGLLMLLVPACMVVPSMSARVSIVLLLLVGSCGLWWVLHKFEGVSERVVGVICIVVGVYLLLGLFVMLSSLLMFRGL